MDVDTLKLELSKKEIELENEKRNFEEYMESSKELEKELEDMLRDSDIKLGEAKDKNEHLEERLMKLQDSFVIANSDVAKLQKELEIALLNAQNLKTAKIALEMENDSFKDRERAMIASIDNLKDKVESAEEQYVLVQEELDTTRSNLKELERRSEQETRDLKCELSTLRMKCESTTNNVSESDIDIVISERDELNDSCALLTERLAGMEKELKETKSRLHDKIRSQEAQLDLLVKEKDGLALKMEELSHDMSLKVVVHEKYKDELALSEANNLMLQEECAKMSGMVTQLELERTKLGQHVEELNELQVKLTKEKDGLYNDVAKKQEELSLYHSKMSELQDSLKVERTLYAEQMEKFAEQNKLLFATSNDLVNSKSDLGKLKDELKTVMNENEVLNRRKNELLFSVNVLKKEKSDIVQQFHEKSLLETNAPVITSDLSNESVSSIAAEEIERFRKQSAELQQECNIIIAQMKDLTVKYSIELSVEREKNTNLVTDCEKLKSSLDKCHEYILSLENELHATKIEMNCVKSLYARKSVVSLENLERKVEDKASFDELLLENEKLRVEMTELKGKLTEKEVKLSDEMKRIENEVFASAEDTMSAQERELRSREAKWRAERDELYIKVTNLTLQLDKYKQISSTICGSEIDSPETIQFGDIYGVPSPQRPPGASSYSPIKKAVVESKNVDLVSSNPLAKTRLFTSILSLRTPVQYVCRLLADGDGYGSRAVSEATRGADPIVLETPDGRNLLYFDRNINSTRTVAFDRVVSTSGGVTDKLAKSQLELFEEVEPLVYAVLHGYNSCLLVNGSSQSGKLLSLFGRSDIAEHSIGLIYLTLKKIFETLDARQLFAEQNALNEGDLSLREEKDPIKTYGQAFFYQVKLSMYDMLGDTVIDLLDSSGIATKVLVSHSSDGTSVIENVKSQVISSLDDALKCIAAAVERRYLLSKASLSADYTNSLSSVVQIEIMSNFNVTLMTSSTDGTAAPLKIDRKFNVRQHVDEKTLHLTSENGVMKSRRYEGKLYLVCMPGLEYLEKQDIDSQHVQQSLTSVGNFVRGVRERVYNTGSGNLTVSTESPLTNVLSDCLGFFESQKPDSLHDEKVIEFFGFITVLMCSSPYSIGSQGSSIYTLDVFGNTYGMPSGRAVISRSRTPSPSRGSPSVRWSSSLNNSVDWTPIINSKRSSAESAVTRVSFPPTPPTDVRQPVLPAPVMPSYCSPTSSSVHKIVSGSPPGSKSRYVQTLGKEMSAFKTVMSGLGASEIANKTPQNKSARKAAPMTASSGHTPSTKRVKISEKAYTPAFDSAKKDLTSTPKRKIAPFR